MSRLGDHLESWGKRSDEPTRLSVDEVFVTSGSPTTTYVSRDAVVEGRIARRLKAGQKVVAISGPSKSGKTVMATRIIRDLGMQRIRISGNDINSVDDFWNSIASQIGVPTAYATNWQATTTLTGTAEAGVSAPFAAAKVGGSASQANANGQVVTSAVDVPRMVRERLEKIDACVLIDDFHYMEEGVRRRVARSLKDMGDQQISLAMIAVPHRVLDLVYEEDDLQGRVVREKVSHWSAFQLVRIAEQGFRALKLVDEGGRLAAELAENAMGSPLLMQELCSELCEVNGIEEAADSPHRLQAPRSWHDFFTKVAEDHPHRLARALLAGLTQRRPRSDRRLRALDREVDNYGAVLLALQQTLHASPKTSITDADLRTAVAAILEKPMALQSIRDTCQGMAQVAREQRREDDATVEFLDGPPATLVIADPYLIFFIRWGLNSLDLPVLSPMT